MLADPSDRVVRRQEKRKMWYRHGKAVGMMHACMGIRCVAAVRDSRCGGGKA